MLAEIPKGEILATGTIRVVGNETPFYRQAGWSRVIPFRDRETDVHLIATGVGDRFYFDLEGRMMITSDSGFERWRLEEHPDYLRYHLHNLINISNLGQSHRQGDRLNFHLLRERSRPGTLSVVDLDINRALGENDPLKVLEFLGSSVALTAAIHRARVSSVATSQRHSRLASA